MIERQLTIIFLLTFTTVTCGLQASDVRDEPIPIVKASESIRRAKLLPMNGAELTRKLKAADSDSKRLEFLNQMMQKLFAEIDTDTISEKKLKDLIPKDSADYLLKEARRLIKVARQAHWDKKSSPELKKSMRKAESDLVCYQGIIDESNDSLYKEKTPFNDLKAKLRSSTPHGMAVYLARYRKAKAQQEKAQAEAEKEYIARLAKKGVSPYGLALEKALTDRRLPPPETLIPHFETFAKEVAAVVAKREGARKEIAKIASYWILLDLDDHIAKHRLRRRTKSGERSGDEELYKVGSILLRLKSTYPLELRDQPVGTGTHDKALLACGKLDAKAVSVVRTAVDKIVQNLGQSDSAKDSQLIHVKNRIAEFKKPLVETLDTYLQEPTYRAKERKDEMKRLKNVQNALEDLSKKLAGWDSRRTPISVSRTSVSSAHKDKVPKELLEFSSMGRDCFVQGQFRRLMPYSEATEYGPFKTIMTKNSDVLKEIFERGAKGTGWFQDKAGNFYLKAPKENALQGFRGKTYTWLRVRKHSYSGKITFALLNSKFHDVAILKNLEQEDSK